MASVCAAPGLPPSGPCVLRALRVCDCTVCARPAHPRAATRARACPAPACRGPARAIRWPPSVLRSACRRPALASFAPCASVTAPSAPGPLTLVPRPGPRVLRVLRVCGCTVRARPVHPRAAARACACPAPACRGPAHAVRPFMCRFFRPHFCRLPSPSLGLVLAAAASCPCVRSCRPNCGLFLFRKNLPPRPACGPAQQEAGEGAHASVPGAFHARNNIRCKRLGHVYAAGAIRRKW